MSKLCNYSQQNEEIALSPIQDARRCHKRYSHLLTEDERKWYADFLAGYYRGDEEALKRICPSRKKRQEIVDEWNYNHHAKDRYTPSETTARGQHAYTSNDYTAAETSPEEAILDSIDSDGKKKVFA